MTQNDFVLSATRRDIDEIVEMIKIQYCQWSKVICELNYSYSCWLLNPRACLGIHAISKEDGVRLQRSKFGC